MDLSNAKKLMKERDWHGSLGHPVSDHLSTYLGLADEVPGLVGEIERLNLQFDVLKRAVEYYLDANKIECELSKVADCKQCAVCHIRVAIQGPGQCCEGYAKHCDAHSVGCVFLKPHDSRPKCECVPGVRKPCPVHGYPPLRPMVGPGSVDE